MEVAAMGLVRSKFGDHKRWKVAQLNRDWSRLRQTRLQRHLAGTPNGDIVGF